jgi:uncharacterized membrane protein YraQ (UPF0718 family)
MRSQGKAKTAGRGGWIFLALVVMLYGIVALLDAGLASRAGELFVRLLGKLLPALLLVFVLLFLMNLLLDPRRVRRYLGRHSGLKGWLVAMVAGVLSTGPVYAWFAVLRDLREKGMRTALVAVMLYARAVKLPLLPLLVHYFGAVYTVVLVVYLLIFSVFSGAIMERIATAVNHRPGTSSGDSH